MVDFLYKAGTQLGFADHAGDFAAAAVNNLEQGTPDGVQLALGSLADAAARQSAKFDLGVNRSKAYSVQAALEMAATGLTAGEVIEFYIGWSTDPIAANANPGGLSGSDAAYSGYSANLTDSIKQLDYIGTFVVTGQASPTIQVADIATIFPKERYGVLVIKNESGAAFHTDDVESHVVFTPITDLSV